MITRQIEGGVEKKHTKDDNGILRQDKKKKETEKTENLRKTKLSSKNWPAAGHLPSDLFSTR
jgi:hypothetical protein